MWSVYGQRHILRQLEPSLKQGRLAHAYLLTGPPHVGKMTLAVNLAQGVNCLPGPGIPCGECSQCGRIAAGNHADVRVVRVARREEGGPARTVIGIDDVKDLLRQASLKPYEGRCTVMVVEGAELMSDEAANALLKTLEEPPPQVLILLLTANADALLATIKSRCRTLELLPVAREEMARRLQEDYSVEAERAERLATLSRGCIGWAINALEDPQVWEQREADLEQIWEVCQSGLPERFNYANELATRFSRDRSAGRELLFLWLQWWRDLAMVKEGVEDCVRDRERLPQLRQQAAGLSTVEVVAFLRALERCLEALDSNANPRLALEVLMLGLPGAAFRQ